MTRGDKLVLVLALALLPALYAAHWGEGGAGEQAAIAVDGKSRLVVDLHHDQHIEIEGPLGASVLEVADGRIRFTDSPCQGKQCIHGGWLSRSGGFTACLPNRVSVAILGGVRAFDSINF